MDDAVRKALQEAGIKAFKNITDNATSDPVLPVRVGQWVAKQFAPDPPRPSGVIVDGPPDSPPNPTFHAKVCVFSSGSAFPLYYDDCQVAKLEEREYIMLWVPPGRHSFVSEKGSIVEMNFQSSTNSYLEITPSFFTSSGIIGLSDGQTWRKRLPRLSHVPAKQIFSAGGRVRLLA